MNQNTNAALTGLLVGDGLSRQNGVHRLSLTTARRVQRFQTLTQFSLDNHLTTLPEPYVHAFPEEILKMHPGDDCEWFYFSAQMIKGNLDITKEWQDLAQNVDQIKGRLGTKSALRNLSRGIPYPHSGHDNPHYFDSLGILRAAAIASFHVGSLPEILETVELDVGHSHALDGLWAAKSIATFIYLLNSGIPVRECILSASKELPDSSLSARTTMLGLHIARESKSELQLSIDLESRLVDRIYCYPYAASELLGMLFAKLWICVDPEISFASAFMHRRHTDSLPPLLGYLLGLIYGDSWLPNLPFENSELDGICIPSLKGKNLMDLTKDM